MHAMTTAFEWRETLTASVTRLDRADAVYFQVRAANHAWLAMQALDADEVYRAMMFQRGAAFFAAEARRSLFRLLEDAR